MKKIPKLQHHSKVQPWERFLILSDLDGTLVNYKGVISPYTKQVIKNIVDAGHIFVIVSGYSPQNTVQYYNELGLKHLMCNLNGAYIWNPSDKGFVPVNLCFNWEIAINILKSKHIMQYVENFVVQNYKGTYMKYVPSINEGLREIVNAFHIRKNQKVTLCRKDLSNLKEVDCHSIIMQVKSKDKNTLNKLIYELHRFSKKLNSHVWYDDDVGYLVEITTKFATKGTALAYLSNYYSIPLEQCIAFGDGDNDVEMLKLAVYSFAMANATVPAKLAAHYITKFTNNQDGLAKTLDFLDKSISKTGSYAAKKKIMSKNLEIERLSKE